MAVLVGDLVQQIRTRSNQQVTAGRWLLGRYLETTSILHLILHVEFILVLCRFLYPTLRDMSRIVFKHARSGTDQSLSNPGSGVLMAFVTSMFGRVPLPVAIVKRSS
ncbi:unnamed protein product [Nezara viridula]|uniref:Uncharacterized protein n=1 Tax=Nezara viridula TaxID=85310 RepID=A0A9P0ECC1_NEZVI|nr:unnamed protein product [Nezara viridula]